MTARPSPPRPTRSTTFTDPGIYTVTLTVVDDGGAVAVASKVITVAANQAPTAVAGATPSSVRVGQTVDVLLGRFG